MVSVSVFNAGTSIFQHKADELSNSKSCLCFRGIRLRLLLENWFVLDLMKIFHYETALQHACMYCFHTAVKAILLHAWTGPEGSRKLRYPDFVTTAQDGG